MRSCFSSSLISSNISAIDFILSRKVVISRTLKPKIVRQADVFLQPLYVCSVIFFQPFSACYAKAYLRWEQKLEIYSFGVRVFLDLHDCLVHRLTWNKGAIKAVFKRAGPANRNKCLLQMHAENKQRPFISAVLNSPSFCLPMLPAFPIVTGVTMR